MQMSVLALRLSCPVTARYIWNAIDIIHHQKQIANFERIRCYLGREYGVSEEKVREQLNYCVRDGLLIMKIESKKKKKTIDQEGYAFPTIFDRDNHDWYCFECHFPGEVLCCSTCYRVFHIKCIAKIDKKSTANKFICYICCSNIKSEILSVERLNYLLGYEFKELKKRLPSSAIEWQRNEPKILIQHLIYNPIDLDAIWEKICSTAYNNLIQFRVDIQTLFHNLVIREGEQSSVTLMVKEAVHTCIKNIKDIQLCADCYQMSHEKNCEFWFCKPCDPPHDLVYAQVKGYPFWPAKVIEKINEKCDVRFFGSFHQRALVEKDRIKPINESIDKLQKLPKTVSWQKACRELKLHQMLLKSDIQKTHEIIRRSEIKKRRTKGKIYNVKRKGVVLSTLSLEKINKYALKTCFPFKREISSKRKKINTMIQRRRKDQNGDEEGEKDHSQKNLTNNIQENDSITIMSFQIQKNMGIQTTCFSMHGHRKYVSDLENEMSLEFAEVNFDCNEIVTRIINSYKQNQNENKSELESHAFCNDNCPLNQCRKNIVSNVEVEKEIQKATSEATNIINSKYGDIVDEMAQSYKMMMLEVQKKIWCAVCLGEATSHCCWGVDYCSQKCRDEHWESGHREMHMQVD